MLFRFFLECSFQQIKHYNLVQSTVPDNGAHSGANVWNMTSAFGFHLLVYKLHTYVGDASFLGRVRAWIIFMGFPTCLNILHHFFTRMSFNIQHIVEGISSSPVMGYRVLQIFQLEYYGIVYRCVNILFWLELFVVFIFFFLKCGEFLL